MSTASRAIAVPVEIGDEGPTFDQIAAARNVIERLSPGPLFIGTAGAEQVDRWLAERQAQLAQDHMKDWVAEVVMAHCLNSGLLCPNDGALLKPAVLHALTNYKLEQI